jgi:hypothetical protein
VLSPVKSVLFLRLDISEIDTAPPWTKEKIRKHHRKNAQFFRNTKQKEIREKQTAMRKNKPSLQRDGRYANQLVLQKQQNRLAPTLQTRGVLRRKILERFTFEIIELIR